MKNNNTMKSTAKSKILNIPVLSGVQVALGFLSVALQIGCLIVVASAPWEIVRSDSYDYVGAGIWCGFIYIGAGGLGFFVQSNPTKSSLIWTITASASSFLAATLTTVLSMTSVWKFDCGDCRTRFNDYKSLFNYPVWKTMEWCLFAGSVLALVNSLMLMWLCYTALSNREYNKTDKRAKHLYLATSV